MSYAQTAAALEGVEDIVLAAFQMAQKAYCKASRTGAATDPIMPYAIYDVAACIHSVEHLGRPTVVRMATFLTEEAARCGEIHRT